MGCREVLLADGERLLVAFRQEITAIFRIGVPGADGGGGRLPVHRPYGIEQPAPVDDAGRHLLQIVRRCQIVTRQPLGLQRPAVAIQPHLRGVREACLLDQGVRQLIESRLGDADLRPRSCLQDAVVGIALSVRAGGTRPGNACGGHIQLERHQFLVSPVAEHQGYQRHLEHALLPHHAHPLPHLGQGRQRLAADLLVAADVFCRHIYK